MLKVSSNENRIKTTRKGIVVDINQTMNSQNLGIDFNPSGSHKPLSNERPDSAKTVETMGRENAAPAQPDAATVSISKQGRAAAAAIDFYAMEENISKLTALGSTDEFARSHAAVSYANVKEFLS